MNNPDEEYDYPAFLQDAMEDDNEDSNKDSNGGNNPNFYGCIIVVVAIVIGFLIFAM